MNKRRGRPPLRSEFAKKGPDREEVTDAVADFLKNGGKIKKIENIHTDEYHRTFNQMMDNIKHRNR